VRDVAGQAQRCVEKIHVTGDADLLRAFRHFEDEMTTSFNRNRYQFIDEPGELSKLGRLLMSADRQSVAMECLITLSKNFLLLRVSAVS